MACVALRGWAYRECALRLRRISNSATVIAHNHLGMQTAWPAIQSAYTVRMQLDATEAVCDRPHCVRRLVERQDNATRSASVGVLYFLKIYVHRFLPCLIFRINYNNRSYSRICYCKQVAYLRDGPRGMFCGHLSQTLLVG